MTSIDRTGMLKIGLIGPSHIGKTTIINCLLRSGESLLTRTSVAMRWADGATERRIQTLRDELQGCLVSRQFKPNAMAGTESQFFFQLKFDPGLPEAELPLQILDYPGAWLDPGRRAGHEGEWEACRAFLAESSVLLIPVDAVILLETLGDANNQYVPANLMLSTVEAIAQDWARERNQHPDEPALAIVCPIRTESYYTDNGGRRDRSEELYERVREMYSPVLAAIRHEVPAARIRYCPIDTLGCVEFVSAEWVTPEGARTPDFRAGFRIRRRADGRPPEISMAGIDDVLVLIVRHLFDLGTNELRRHAAELQRNADELTDWADRDAGMFMNVWYRMSGKRSRWQTDAQRGRGEAKSAHEVVANLGRQLKSLAEHQLSSRIRDL